MNTKIRDNLFSVFNQREFTKILDKIQDGKNASAFITHLPLKVLFLDKLLASTHKKIFLITNSFYTQQDFIGDFKFFNDNLNVFGLAESIQTKKEISTVNESVGSIISNLTNFAKSGDSIAIAPIDELAIKLPTMENVNNKVSTLKVGTTCNYNDFIQEMLLNGFSKTDYVAFEGDISIRGGIIDFFPLGMENPIRVDFFGDEIESIREFDPLSQRSIKSHTEIMFFKSIFNTSQIETYSTIFDYLPKDVLLVLDNIDLSQISEDIKSNLSKFHFVELNPLQKADFSLKADNQPNFNGSIKEFVQFLTELSKINSYCILTSDNKVYIERLKSIIEKYIEESEEANLKYSIGNYLDKIKWISQPLSSGFITKDLRYAVITEHQIFDRAKKISTKQKTSKTTLSLKELETLQIGDYIVHEDKGIGVFDGLQTLKIGGVLQDCVRIKFQDDDILYLNLNYINKIDKYSSADGMQPKLSKLGTVDWERKKARLKKKLKDISRELITLYAKRKSEAGIRYPGDTVWQREFEASFIYEDTIDQSKATDDVKKDMGEDYPMDRLICGDVGFGKTEIAIRAAFKAATAGKQVAVLVPTTILAQQHFMSFKDRMSKYPVNIALLSRFRTQNELKESISRIKAGKIDIAIGTHRLLSSDVEFKDLGLLIIDEEHRFGVSAKEKLRQIKSHIDTLTMTATPIPRTLNFSLLGVRDISIIETPPPNRLPVYTEVVKWSKQLFRENVLKELSRNGQIFFVSDKVYDLDTITTELQSIVPEARFGIAHGQMKPSELEKIMENFIEKKFDVLVTTKIIESGLDIPNANTIFINRSHNFGLAELYQLRGRVGRNNIQAYCYLIIPDDIKLPEKSVRRLQALEEFTELGSGLKLAMRDMEIRGTGNLLGAEQSGFIDDMGYEMYSKILEQSVQELKEEEFSDLFDSKKNASMRIIKNPDLEIDFDQSSFLPNSYIPSDTERYAMYKRLYAINQFDEIKDIEKELIDRFGKLPLEAQNLMFVVRLRYLCTNTGFKKAQIKGNNLTIEFPTENPVYYEKIFPLLLDYINTLELDNLKFRQAKSKLTLNYDFKEKNEVVEFLWKLKKIIGLSIEN